MVMESFLIAGGTRPSRIQCAGEFAGSRTKSRTNTAVQSQSLFLPSVVLANSAFALHHFVGGEGHERHNPARVIPLGGVNDSHFASL
jgi:hypothetical protein